MDPAPMPAKILPARMDEIPVMVIAPKITATAMAVPATDAMNDPGEAKSSADMSSQK